MTEGTALRYHLVRPLGVGGMGEVWLAQDQSSPGTPHVALKRMHPHLARDEHIVQQFEREARISAALKHPNIVAMKDFGQDDDGPYLVLEYIRGPSASALVKTAAEKGGRLPMKVALSIARDMTRGLLYAHTLDDVVTGGTGVIHRDLSPDNVLLEANGEAKLADFGIAKVVGGTTLTKSGTVKGKFGFMAPEMLEGAEADVRSDVFSLAATLYTILCGVRPFAGRTEAEQVRALLECSAPPVRGIRPDVPVEIASWLERALQREPKQRPTGCEDLLRILDRHSPLSDRGEVATFIRTVFPGGFEWAPQLSSAKSKTRSMRMQASQFRRKPSRLLAGGAALLVVVAVLAFVLWPGKKAPPVVATLPQPAPPAVVVHDALPTTPIEPIKEEPPAPKPLPTTLWVKVAPWAQVFVDGQLKGVTPLPPIPVSPGKHSVILVNGQLHVQKKVSVDVHLHENHVLKEDLSPRRH